MVRFINTKHFDYIAAIADTKSLSAASRRLGISQSVLSRYLSGLEKELGISLFSAENRCLKITEAGKIYLNGVMRMKELQTQMFRAFRALDGAEELTLSIGMSPFRGGYELASFYPKLLSRFPTLHLDMTEGTSDELFQKLYRKEISCVLNLYHASLLPGTKIAAVSKRELFLALPDYHPLSGSGPVISSEQLRSLTDIPFVFQDSHTIVGQMIDQVLKNYDASPNVLLRTSNSIAVQNLLKTGSYAGFTMQNPGAEMQSLSLFHLPHPVYLYSGMIFLEDYQPTEVEQYLYTLNCEKEKLNAPETFYINRLGNILLNGSSN